MKPVKAEKREKSFTHLNFLCGPSEVIRIKKNRSPTMGRKWPSVVVACIICCFKVVSKLERKGSSSKIQVSIAKAGK